MESYIFINHLCLNCIVMGLRSGPKGEFPLQSENIDYWWAISAVMGDINCGKKQSAANCPQARLQWDQYISLPFTEVIMSCPISNLHV